MRVLRRLLLLLLAAPLGAQRSPFPHDRHAKLFATCEACHAGIARDARASAYPAPATCASCHDGTIEQKVEWSGRRTSTASGLLVFSHAKHRERADTATPQCRDCHAIPGATRFMDVAAARTETCFGCHAHRTAEHYAAPSRCATCHTVATNAKGLTPTLIRALPQPASHRERDFIVKHAPDSTTIRSCATCHARESCARCHPNAGAVATIRSLGSDPRFRLAVEGTAARYAIPADHREASYAAGHGAQAMRSVVRCANCHTQPSCRACHSANGAQRVIARLPDGRAGAQGVQLRRVAATPVARVVADTGVVAVAVHPAAFARSHAGTARASGLVCEGCHAPDACTSCHTGEVGNKGGFHPPAWSSRHATDAYARESDCATCHTTEVFCRSCHQAVGIGGGAVIRAKPATFHNANAAWLLEHGRAARQGLTSCVTCHRQQDCMRCHSTLGWGVSPHGPDFDASRLQGKVAPMCLRCHVTLPK